MHYVYVLRSKKNGKKYVGLTGKSPEERLEEHNNGSNQYTKGNRPFELVYFEECNDKEFALKREKFLKSGNGRSVLKRKLEKM